jgi:peptide deformylase
VIEHARDPDLIGAELDFREVALNFACNSFNNQAFMAILNILNYPDPRLYKVAIPVQQVDDSIRRLIDDMAETMYEAPGIGLAATQVDVHQQLIVIDTSEDKQNLQVFINPRITSKSGSRDYEEGCLSVPGVYESVTRAEKITVEALDRNGKSFTLHAEGLLAVCIQHEMDHLLGKVFVEYLSPLKQSRIKSKMKKRQRER